MGGIVEYLDWCVEQKQKYNKDTPTFTLNIQRFPKFQNPLILPFEMRLSYATQLKDWLAINEKYLHNMEVEHVSRLIDYLNSESNQLGDDQYIGRLRNDFKKYYTQFDQRRNKNFSKTFTDLAEWYKTLNT